LSFKLRPGEVQYFEITLLRPSVNTKFANPEEFKLWDKLMGEKSN